MADPVIMRSREGDLFEVQPEDVEQLQRDRGYVPAEQGDVEQRQTEREQYAEFGSTAQQARGLAETFLRNATLGAVKGLDAFEPEEDTRARANVVAEESPVLNFAAGVAPGLAAGIATGGAVPALGVGGAALVEGAIGGLSGVGAAADEAFRHDQELSAESALGSFGGGFLLGGALGAAGAGAGKALGAARNRFVEASGKVARQAEGEAFSAAGVVRPVKGLSEAMTDPVKAAKLRQVGAEARPGVQQKFAEELGALDNAEQAARQFDPTPPAAVGDNLDPFGASRPRAALRDALDGARRGLEPIASPKERGLISRAFDALDRAGTPDELYQVARSARAALDEALDASGNPAVAKVLKRSADSVREIEQNATLFGAAGEASAARYQALQDLADARQQLVEAADAGDYFASVGTKTGAGVETALDSYLERLGAVLRESDAPAAKDGLAAIGRLQKLRDGDLQKLAGANQADALRQVAPKQAPNPIRDILGEVAETALEAVVPGVGLARKAWKYRKHVARLAGAARDDAGAAADRLLGTALTAVGRGSRALTRAAVPLAGRAPVFAELQGTPEQQYEKVREVVTLLSNEPDRLAEALAEQMGDVPSEAPDLMMALSAKAQRGVDFIRSKLPPAFEFSLLYPEGPPPSRADILELGLYWRGVWQPREVLRAIGDGSAMPEEVEAFRYMNPVWFGELQDACHERIVEKNREGEVVGAFRVAQLEQLLDLPGKLDPTFSDGVAAVAQATTAAQQENQRQATYVPPPKAGQRIQPESLDRIKS